MPNSLASGRAALVPWMVVGAVWVTLAIASGLYFSFPVFFVALLEEFGWSRGATAAAFSISSIVQGTLAPVVGILVDRVGPRRVMLGGACLLSGACVLSSQIGSLWSLYVVTGVLGASGLCAVSWVPSGALISRWFTERRGSMLGLAFSGMGAGVLAIGPLAQWLITMHGWRAAYLVLGLGTFVVLVPLVWLAVRGGPLRLCALLRPRLRCPWPHHHRDGVPALPGAALRRHLRHPERGQRHRRWCRAVVRRYRARPDRELSRRLPGRRRLLCAGLGVLLARAPSSSAPVTRPSQESAYSVGIARLTECATCSILTSCEPPASAKPVRTCPCCSTRSKRAARS